MIKAKIIIEIAGRPKEHIESTLKLLTEKFAEAEKDVKIIWKKIHEPEKVDIKGTKQEFFSAFVEYELELQGLLELVHIAFNWLPSHIEILEPEHLKLSADEISQFFTDLAAKLHQQDSVIKTLSAQNEILRKKLDELKMPKLGHQEVEVKPGEVTDITPK